MLLTMKNQEIVSLFFKKKKKRIDALLIGTYPTRNFETY